MPAPMVPPAHDLARPVRRVLGVVVAGTLGVATIAAALAQLVGDADAGVVVRPGWIVAGGVLWTLALPFQALRWRALVPGPPLPVGPLSALVVGANLLNLALPGPTGELAAAWVAHRRWGVPLVVAVVTSVLARVLALSVLGVLVLGAWPLVAGEGSPSWLRLGALTAGGGAAALASTWVWPGLVERAIRALAALLPARIGERLSARGRWWGESLGALGRLGPARWLAAAGWSAVSTGVLGLASLAAFHGAGLAPPAPALLFTHLLASLAIVSALVLPGGLGAMEAVFAAVLPQLAPVGPVDAALGALAIRQSQLLSMLLSLPALLWVLRLLPADPPPAPPVAPEAPPSPPESA